MRCRKNHQETTVTQDLAQNSDEMHSKQQKESARCAGRVHPLWPTNHRTRYRRVGLRRWRMDNIAVRADMSKTTVGLLGCAHGVFHNKREVVVARPRRLAHLVPHCRSTLLVGTHVEPMGRQLAQMEASDLNWPQLRAGALVALQHTM